MGWECQDAPHVPAAWPRPRRRGLQQEGTPRRWQRMGGVCWPGSFSDLTPHPKTPGAPGPREQ